MEICNKSVDFSGRILCNLNVMDKDECDLDCLDSTEENNKAK